MNLKQLREVLKIASAYAEPPGRQLDAIAFDGDGFAWATDRHSFVRIPVEETLPEMSLQLSHLKVALAPFRSARTRVELHREGIRIDEAEVRVSPGELSPRTVTVLRRTLERYSSRQPWTSDLRVRPEMLKQAAALAPPGQVVRMWLCDTATGDRHYPIRLAVEDGPEALIMPLRGA